MERFCLPSSTPCETAVRPQPGQGGLELSSFLEARSPEVQVMTGRVGPTAGRDRLSSEIEIMIPSEGAVAEISYETPDGRMWCQAMSERQISVIPPGQRHRVSWPRVADLTIVRIGPQLLKRLAQESGIRAAAVVGQYGSFDPVIWHFGRELHAELRRHRKLDRIYLDSVGVVLGRHLLSTGVMAALPREGRGLPLFKLRRAFEYVHENVADNISVSDIAAHLQMSRSHFARMFKQSTGQSPRSYIARYRVDRAKTLLAEGRLPISQIALEVGYKSQSYFTTSFARLTGVTPAVFRAIR